MNDNTILIFTHALLPEKTVYEKLAESIRDAAMLNVKLFTTDNEFLRNFNDKVLICILDHSDDMNNILWHRLINFIHEYNPICKIIVLSEQDDKASIIDMLNKGVDRYVDKKGQVDYAEQTIKFIKELAAIVQKELKLLNVVQGFIEKYDPNSNRNARNAIPV